MINKSQLIPQLKALSALDIEKINVPADMLGMQADISTDFYRSIAPIDSTYSLVNQLPVMKWLEKDWPENTLILGVDGSLYVAKPPSFRSVFVITNTAVFAYNVTTREYDFRIYTKLYAYESDRDTTVVDEDATLYMLADEAEGVAKYLNEHDGQQALAIFDGVMFSDVAQNYLLKHSFHITQDIKTHPATEIYQRAMGYLALRGTWICSTVSMPSTSYVSPIVQYNACPYKSKSDQPMNCDLCRKKEGGYNFDCETYIMSDVTYFLNLVNAQYDFAQHSRLFFSAPIFGKKDKISTYVIQPQNRWFVRVDVPLEIYKTDGVLRKVLTGVGMQTIMGEGYPYVLHEAHGNATIDGKSRAEIEEIARMLGLYGSTPKAQGKKLMASLNG